MIVFQTRDDGVFVGIASADPDPMEKGRFALPAGCVEEAPPKYDAGHRARWNGKSWITETDPQMYLADSAIAVTHAWDGESILFTEVPAPELAEGETAKWDGLTWTVIPPEPEEPSPPQFASQDLMAQFTPADMVKIMAAVNSDTSGATMLLWYSMVAQRDAMLPTNDRVKTGWSALIKVLGQKRMDEIAAALNVTVTV